MSSLDGTSFEVQNACDLETLGQKAGIKNNARRFAP